MELLVFLLCASWCMSVTEQAPSYLITAPKIVRIGVKETVTIQMFEARGNFDASIYLLNQREMAVCSDRHTVKLNHTNNFAEVLFIQILPENARQCKLSRRSRYVTLAVEIPKLLSRRRMIHLHIRPKPYFIFIETDKPTYRPNDTVRFQTFSLDHELKLSRCDVDVEIRQSNTIVAMARSRTQGPTAVCRGEVQLPSSLVGDFEMQGSSTLYSAYQGHKPFQIKEHGGMEEKKSIVPNFLKYAINLTKTKRYFIPGAPFQIMALVTYLDGSRVSEVPIKIKIIISAGKTLESTQEGLTDSIGELSLSFNVPENAKDIYISVRIYSQKKIFVPCAGQAMLQLNSQLFHGFSNPFTISAPPTISSVSIIFCDFCSPIIPILSIVLPPSLVPMSSVAWALMSGILLLHLSTLTSSHLVNQLLIIDPNIGAYLVSHDSVLL